MPQLIKTENMASAQVVPPGCTGGSLGAGTGCGALPRAVDLQQIVRDTKNAAYDVPLKAKEAVKAVNKSTPPATAAPPEPWWRTLLGFTPVALIPGVKKTPAELAADPKTPAEHLGDNLKAALAGAADGLKWLVVGLVAVAVIVVIPRLFSRK
jgi:hypothetical protein